MKNETKGAADFWANVDIGRAADCWYWLASTGSHGYGQMTMKMRPWLAHRLAWLLHHGEDPGKLLVLHKCDNKRCCNPSHLFLGTSADNTLDMCRKGRSPNQRLNDVAVRVIRHLVDRGVATQAAVAAAYGVSAAKVCSIIKRKSWRHV